MSKLGGKGAMEQENKIRKNVNPDMTGTKVKMVAERPEDEEIQANLEEMKKNDGYPGSCGGL
jgi:hypothetical protein